MTLTIYTFPALAFLPRPEPVQPLPPPAKPARPSNRERRAAFRDHLFTVMREGPKPQPGRFTLFDLAPDSCRFPNGDDDIRYCGRPQRKGSSYCARCHAIAYVRSEPA